MKRVTFHLDDETDRAARAAAAAAGVSYSRWLYEQLVPTLKKRLGEDWPPEVQQLIGSVPDFPLRDPSCQ